MMARAGRSRPRRDDASHDAAQARAQQVVEDVIADMASGRRKREDSGAGLRPRLPELNRQGLSRLSNATRPGATS